MKRVANNYNSARRSFDVMNAAYLYDVTALCNAPDVEIVDELSATSHELQHILRQVFDHIVDADHKLGFVILDDDTIRCTTTNSYIAQFDGCKYWEVSLSSEQGNTTMLPKK